MGLFSTVKEWYKKKREAHLNNRCERGDHPDKVAVVTQRLGKIAGMGVIHRIWWKCKRCGATGNGTNISA